MKHRFSQDERVITKNGHVSPARMAAVEALEAQGRDGATAEEMVLLIGSDLPGKRPLGSLGQVLSYMQTDELVVLVGDRWYLKEYAPQPEIQVKSDNTNGYRAKIAPLVQKRSGRTVSVYTAPTVYSDVISLALLIKEQWFEIPFWGAIRVCVGKEIPDWSADKRWYYNVTVIKITFKGGAVEERQPDSKDVITIDAEE